MSRQYWVVLKLHGAEGFKRFSYRSKTRLGRERAGVSPPFVHASTACVSAQMNSSLEKLYAVLCVVQWKARRVRRARNRWEKVETVWGDRLDPVRCPKLAESWHLLEPIQASQGCCSTCLSPYCTFCHAGISLLRKMEMWTAKVLLKIKFAATVKL